MIPVSSKEHVEYKDDDGMLWKFKPKTGTLEAEQFNLWEDGITMKEMCDRQNKFLDKIIISPVEEYKKADYNSDEKSKIIRFWNIANRLTAKEKKS